MKTAAPFFLPQHPETRPRLERIMQSESHLEIQRLVDKAVETRETLEV